MSIYKLLTCLTVSGRGVSLNYFKHLYFICLLPLVAVKIFHFISLV